MLRRDYNNFVRSTSPAETVKVFKTISGDEAKQLYLEEVHEVGENKDPLDVPQYGNDKVVKNVSLTKRKRNPDELDVSNLKLFTCVQDNDVDNLQQILDACPNKIKTVDDYGWSLLMIACQANSHEVVKELLKRGADTTVQDKAGNSAQNLIIRNRNSYLADILLSHVSNSNPANKSDSVVIQTKHKMRHKENYVCEICDHKSFKSKKEHLSSTLHNINASKGRKIPTNYVIPQTNKGYQIMLKAGWDKETGLGPDGSGKKYPIKTVQKNDKRGLGHDKKRLKISNEKTPKQPTKHLESSYQRNRRIEINFRREFY